MQAKIKNSETPMASKSPAGYSLSQILLHWLIALLVLYQIFFHEGMEHAYEELSKGEAINPSNALGASIHQFVGITVLVLAILRLIIRMARGVPAAPAGQSAIKLRIAAATQHILYLLIVLMPITGALAWFGGISFMAVIHQIGVPLILIAVFVHFAGALMQHFIAKTDVLVRMVKPGSSRAA
jgi:cytochrome b561